MQSPENLFGVTILPIVAPIYEQVPHFLFPIFLVMDDHLGSRRSHSRSCLFLGIPIPVSSLMIEFPRQVSWIVSCTIQISLMRLNRHAFASMEAGDPEIQLCCIVQSLLLVVLCCYVPHACSCFTMCLRCMRVRHINVEREPNPWATADI